MCCGGGSRQPQPTSTQVVEQKSEFPEEIKPYITDILGKSQALFGKQSGEGYQVFPGGVEGRIAPLESEQLEALEAYKIVTKYEKLNPSLEPCHAFAEAIKIAPKLSKDTIIIVNSCGDALKDRDILKERLGKLK